MKNNEENRLDSIIENQDEHRAENILGIARIEQNQGSSELNAIVRDAVLDQKSCERDKNREVCWKRRFYISWGLALLVIY